MTTFHFLGTVLGSATLVVVDTRLRVVRLCTGIGFDLDLEAAVLDALALSDPLWLDVLCLLLAVFLRRLARTKRIIHNRQMQILDTLGLFVECITKSVSDLVFGLLHATIEPKFNHLVVLELGFAVKESSAGLQYLLGQGLDQTDLELATRAVDVGL